ncbi:MAG TPA: CrcB family protein [Actinophytocola sp.]|nr:CrcB family protein [Actinophytocola sp.]
MNLTDTAGTRTRDRVRARVHGPVLGVVALGGGLGALARYGLTVLLPTPPGGFPWATFLVNVLGCLLIGVLMVPVTEVHAAHRLVRPFLGVGVLGGFTTFSTYALEVHSLLRPGSVGVAFATSPPRWWRPCSRSSRAPGPPAPSPDGRWLPWRLGWRVRRSAAGTSAGGRTAPSRAPRGRRCSP